MYMDEYTQRLASKYEYGVLKAYSHGPHFYAIAMISWSPSNWHMVFEDAQ